MYPLPEDTADDIMSTDLENAKEKMEVLGKTPDSISKTFVIRVYVIQVGDALE